MHKDENKVKENVNSIFQPNINAQFAPLELINIELVRLEKLRVRSNVEYSN